MNKYRATLSFILQDRSKEKMSDNLRVMIEQVGGMIEALEILQEYMSVLLEKNSIEDAEKHLQKLHEEFLASMKEKE